MSTKRYSVYVFLFITLLALSFIYFIGLEDAFAKNKKTIPHKLIYTSAVSSPLDNRENHRVVYRYTSTNGHNIINERDINLIIKNMTLPELVGQMFFSSINTAIPNQELANFLTNYHIGGVILFANNIRSVRQTIELTNFIQQNSPIVSNYRINLFIGTDQEGGLVNRLKTIMRARYTLSEYQMGRLYYNNPGYAEYIYYNVGRVMNYLGINLNFAPEVDVAYNEQGFVNKQQRSYSNNPFIVTKLSQAAIKGYHNAGVITCLKHFAGLGRASTDPQYHPPIIDESYNTLYHTDWQPYIEAINLHDAYMIMVSHGIYPELDPRYPASLSYNIITNILRKELHYNGVVITDDLTMGALKDYGDIGQRAIYAINAGADIVLICHNYKDTEEAYQEVLNAVEDGEIPKWRIIQSVRRILMLKAEYSLIKY